MSSFPGRKEQILDRLSFEAFYQGELGSLKATSGDNWQAVCPFHEDTNPSLSVNFKTGLFMCFACGAQGDVFKFYQDRHGCDFKEALAALGRQAGVDLKDHRLEACATGIPGHLSEIDLDGWEGYDHVIDNDGSLENLKWCIEAVLAIEADKAELAKAAG